MHIGMLAAMLKVPQAKLEALEADRHEQLPDPVFARALAQSVCRALKVDPAPVMQRLPAATPLGKLERVDEGLKTPLRERGSGIGALFDAKVLKRPAFWLVALAVAGALALSLLPSDWIRTAAALIGGHPSPAPAAAPPESVSIPGALPASALAGGIVEKVNAAVEAASAVLLSAPPASSAALDSGAAAPTAAPVASTVVRAVERTWIQVTDARGQVLVSRLLSAGEVVGLAEPPPLRIRIGNAQGTQVVHQGREVDLAPATRDNVATVELQ